MSGTVPTTTTTTTAPPVEWKTPAAITVIFNQTLMLVALVIVCYMHIEDGIMMVIGAIVGGYTTGNQFYLGSSKSSQTKDATIAAQMPVPTPPPGSTTVTSTPAKTTVTTDSGTSTSTAPTPPIIVNPTPTEPIAPIIINSGTVATSGTVTP